MLKEFQEFISKGNVMDLAVGVIIGGAFGKIVTSLVNDVIMPIVGAIFGGLDFNELFPCRSPRPSPPRRWPRPRSRAPSLPMATSSPSCINFLILAWIIFLMVKAVNNLRRRLEKREAPAPPRRRRPMSQLLTEIRDLLARK